MKPPKSMLTYPSTRMPKSSWMVFSSSSTPPREKALLMRLSLYPGMGTYISRMKEVRMTSWVSGLRVQRIMLSDRWPVSPSVRESSPTRRMLVSLSTFLMFSPWEASASPGTKLIFPMTWWK